MTEHTTGTRSTRLSFKEVLQTRRICWSSPSNIALVKYWGKHGEQLPANPSLSLTLSKAVTTTEVEYKPGTGKVEFYFHDKREEGFAERVAKYVQRLAVELPTLRDKDFIIHSENSFPHSAGIASSASAMSALALCLTSIEWAQKGTQKDDEFWKTSSNYARLGSGSACRSVQGPVMLWGEAQGIEQSSDEFAVKVPGLNGVFNDYRDAILIVDSGKKSVSSSAGHGLMKGHPFGSARFAQATANLDLLLQAMRRGDLVEFGRIVELEALTLHAMMLTSSPSYVLMKPGTLEVIDRLKEFRAATDVPVYMTLDAGPNVHLLYPESAAAQVEPWINSELLAYCDDGRVIFDRTGAGASIMI